LSTGFDILMALCFACAYALLMMAAPLTTSLRRESVDSLP